MKFGIIGFGKMGSSIVDGVLDGLFEAKDVIAYDKNTFAQESICAKNLTLAKSEAEVYENADVMLIAVKPQDIAGMLSALSVCEKHAGLVISIAAGVPISLICGYLKDVSCARIMPNTCATIKMSASCVCFNERCSSEDKKRVFDIFNKIGICEQFDESLMDEVIPISGSFTAFAYTYIKAFRDAAVKHGIDAGQAMRLILQSTVGSAAMIAKGEKPVEQLISDVCSKGGTTLAGLEQLEMRKLDEAVEACFTACADRSRELGRQHLSKPADQKD